MVTQVPLLTKIPNTLDQSVDEFSDAVDTMVRELNPMASSMNTVAQEVQTLASNAESAAGAIANAVWVSGTTYTAGNVRYSPIDFLDYRRKTNGAGTTDPSLDVGQVDWAPRVKTSAGGAITTSSAVDIPLTSSSSRLQILSMTASGKKVTLPSASTLNKGGPLFIINNAGTYRFAIRNNGGVFLCYAQPGQVIMLHCSDTSTASGVWQISCDVAEKIFDGNNPETLNGVDSRNIAVAMLSSTKAICAFRNNSTTFLNAVILNFGSASGTPVAINAEASEFISIAAQTGSQATVIYKMSTGVTKAYVLDNPSGTTITPGPVATIDTVTLVDGTGIAALSATKLICSYGSTGGAKEKVLDISASAITQSAAVIASAVLMEGNPNFIFRKVTGSKALLAGFVNNANVSVLLALQSITGSTPAQTGSSLTITGPGTITLRKIGVVVMNASRALLAQPIDRNFGDIMLSIIDISGTSPVLVASKIIRVGLVAATHISMAKLDGSDAYMTWTGGASGGIDACMVTLTADDRLLIGQQSERIDTGVASVAGYLDCDALDSTHVMQVHRNNLSFLSAKTIELSL